MLKKIYECCSTWFFGLILKKIYTMKKILILSLVFFMSNALMAQEKFNVYNPEADAKQEIENAVKIAQNKNKHILIQVGGNWCGWCKLFYDLVTTDEEISKYLNENFEVVHLNYSKENSNLDVLETLDFPQRFGFPVFVILDKNGNRIHTQNSAYLEEGKGHSPKKVLEFLKHWSPASIDPKSYKK